MQTLDLSNAKDFARLHEGTAGLLTYVAGQLGVPADQREDVAQQAYLRLLESGRSFTFDHAKAYLICAVRSIVIDMRRRAATRKTTVQEDWSGLEGRALWESDARHERMVAAVTAALDRLEKSSGTVLLTWFYREGLSVKEIQARTGDAVGTITAKLCRLRRQLAPALQVEVDASLAGQIWP